MTFFTGIIMLCILRFSVISSEISLIFRKFENPLTASSRQTSVKEELD